MCIPRLQTCLFALARMNTTRNAFKVPTHATALLIWQKLLVPDPVAGSGVLVPDPVNV